MQSQLSSVRHVLACRDEIARAIQEMCLNKLSIDIESPDMDLFETGLLDSICLVELIMFVETRYRIKLPMEELMLDSLRCVRSIAGSVADCIDAEAGAR